MGSKARGIEVAPHVDDADGDVDLGVDNALRGQPLHHAPGGQLVVVRVDQPPGDGLEGLNKAGEIVEAVEGLGLGAASWAAHRGGRSAPPAWRA